ASAAAEALRNIERLETQPICVSDILRLGRRPAGIDGIRHWCDFSRLVNVTHLGRGATAAQRVALLWSSPKCANAECSSMFVQIDHRDPWADTKHTPTNERDHLCPHDRDLNSTHDT